MISVEKIQNYVNRYLAEKDELEASQLPLNNEEDFIKLIYVRLYGQRKNMGYVIETLEEREVKRLPFRKIFGYGGEKMEYLEGMLQKEKDNFSRVCNRLLGTCFLCKGNQNTKADYYFVLKYRKEFKEYLGVLGYRLR